MRWFASSSEKYWTPKSSTHTEIEVFDVNAHISGSKVGVGDCAIDVNLSVKH